MAVQVEHWPLAEIAGWEVMEWMDLQVPKRMRDWPQMGCPPHVEVVRPLIGGVE